MDSLTEIIVEFELSQILDIVQRLRADGFRQSTDFDFTYNPRLTSTVTYETTREQHTVFHFYNPELATLFALKYI